MKKILNMKLAIMLLAVLGAACTPKAKDTNHNFQSPKGDNAGQVVFFTNDASLSNKGVASIMINNKFLAAMQYGKQHIQGLCAGDYVVEAKAIAPKVNKQNQIQHHRATNIIKVEAGKTKYVLLERKAKTPFLSLKEVDKAMWEKQGKLVETNERSNNTKFVHRLSSTVMNCETTTK